MLHAATSILCLANDDWQFLAASAACGFIGSLVRALLLRNPINDAPKRGKEPVKFSWAFVYARWNWWLAYLVVGPATGLLVWLLFVDTLKPGLRPMAHVLALSMLAGYGAQEFWERQANTLDSRSTQRDKRANADDGMSDRNGPPRQKD